MTLVNNLSALKQRLITKIPTSLGVSHYQTIVLTHGVTVYTFTAKVTEPSPSMLINFLSLGVTINSDNLYVTSIPLVVPVNALKYGKMLFEDGQKGETRYVMTTAIVENSAIVTLFRTRT